jgi:hypothetical protein
LEKKLHEYLDILLFLKNLLIDSNHYFKKYEKISIKKI